MREILFRGKRKDNGEWVEGYFCRRYFPELPHDRCVIQYKTESTKEWRPAYMVAEVIPKTVGQYTGLSDKNGKKIFEGDIVTNPKGDIGRVTWYEEHCAFMIYSITENKVYWLFDNDFSLIEIIGNIHDNPELLKGGVQE